MKISPLLNRSATIGDHLEAHREDRISKITSGETPVPLDGGPKMVLHLIPLSSIETPRSVDVSSIELAHEGLVLLGSESHAGDRFNFDGRIVAHFP